MLKKQTYHPKGVAPRNIARISTMRVQHSEGCEHRERGWRWRRYQLCRGDVFSLVAVEGYSAGTGGIAYMNQEDYVKINFLLSGKRTTVLDGFGQYEHDRPEVFLTSGPSEMIKVDMLRPDTRVAQVCLYVQRNFFPVHLGLALEDLPEPLRSVMLPHEIPYAFHVLAFTPSLAAATRAILSAPFAVRRAPAYARAKAIELMCLLIDRMATENRKSCDTAEVPERLKSRLYDARELLSQNYAQAITLKEVSKEVGLSKVALTRGFRQLFGVSVHDFLQKERMEHAYELLRDKSYSIGQVAESVGYTHSCNFSTAFRAFYGYTPQKFRSS